MLWFVAAFIIASGIFKFAPANVTSQTIAKSSKDGLGHISLSVLPIVILTWLLITIFQGEGNSFGAASFGFIVTACSIALPRMHKFIIPCALLTSISLIIGVLHS
ncbi:hypothetical protein [Shewanella nanhaiensis]|uniref:Branched-chain amino acid ABC transporter n=1 Tax=Shewanella nanhaiensis TaxID=2864872 RepID=A0ABS7E472_9GAMM|nr:hypothetical protein [Shewanella nanhaiensis]MBW8184399.1 hypothetical protein [Shewanella nanhaiensis]